MTRRERIMTEFEHEMNRFPNENGDDASCRDRALEFQDYPPRQPPTDEEARALCADCPANKLLCRQYGMAIKGSGVWGGVVLINGNIRKRLETELEFVDEVEAEFDAGELREVA